MQGFRCVGAARLFVGLCASYHERRMASSTLELQLELVAEGDPADLADMTARLRREVLQLDVEAVDHRIAGDVPPGAKALDAAMVGTLVVTLAKSGATLASVVRAAQLWLSRSSNRTIKVELDGDSIELTGVASGDQQRLIDLWIERHSAPA